MQYNDTLNLVSKLCVIVAPQATLIPHSHWLHEAAAGTDRAGNASSLSRRSHVTAHVTAHAYGCVNHRAQDHWAHAVIQSDPNESPWYIGIRVYHLL
jgi:hypothetical protein